MRACVHACMNACVLACTRACVHACMWFCCFIIVLHECVYRVFTSVKFSRFLGRRASGLLAAVVRPCSLLLLKWIWSFSGVGGGGGLMF